MTKWTKEQLEAINTSGTNIIVSAGAGSGKTAVLTERVITKIKSGINIQNLLILTFTNAAANEMKDRIREAIKKEESLKEQLDYIDSSYITTFDSFSMSVVKKYHYLLNISSKINIIDSSIINNVRSELLDQIFEEKYKSKDESFIKFITDFTIKDDTQIKKNILNINTKLDRLINKKEYLKRYLNNYYNDNNINMLINEFNNYLIEKINSISATLNDLYNFCDEDFYNKIHLSLINLLNSKTYDEILNNINVSTIKAPRNSEDELKTIKERLYSEIKKLRKILIYKDSSHIKSTLVNTKIYASSIIDIVLTLDERLNEYKNINDKYEFNDIAVMAINLIETNDNVREELTKSFFEIMLDEYQDTSDIQEKLISLISNNNVYMVGDIKQSIYRFRNANPDIFKNKYDEYSNNNGGVKIDLLNNFRSRKEVIDDINTIFNETMSLNIGGASYKESHQMNFGNTSYNDNHPKQNFNLEIYNYKRENKKYSNSEYEAFIIGNDIKNKIESGYEILDKKTNSLRKVNYEDFVILLDRKSNFELYRKIFKYLGIPLVIYYDEKITNERDLLIIKNIIDLIIRIHNNIFDEKFKYDFYSISRSYISNYNDQVFIDLYNNNKYKDTFIYQICEEISNNLDTISSNILIDEIINKFNFYKHVIKVGEIDKFIVIVDYLKSLSDNLSALGYSILEFNDYLQDMVINDSDITFSLNTKVPNNVKLMNIHKSKGLEFPICYFGGYEKKFNRDELNNTFNFDSKYGFIIPFYDDGIGNTIVKELFKNKYIKEDISERIRLLYVSLTRAREKMIVVSSLSKEETLINEDVKLNYKSFLDIIESIKDNVSSNIVNIDEISLTKKYYINKEIKFSFNNNEKIEVNEININNTLIESSNASKHINNLLTKKDVDKLKYGTKIHRLLETSDFISNNNEIIIKLIDNFDFKDVKIYKEYEFITSINSKEYHGIIDLMLEYPDYINIIDYKLKEIEDANYMKQLNIYKEYICDKTKKHVNVYLYSIINNELKKIA